MTQVVFLHVPKTAGTTLHKVMEENIGPIALYSPRSTPEVVARFGEDFDAFMEKVNMATGPARAALLADLRAHPAVGGHTTSAILPYLNPDRFVFTSLREAGDRLVSWYFHHCHPDDPEKMYRIFREETKGLGFDDFLRFAPMLDKNDNAMVRYFAQVGLQERVAARHLEEAKATLAGLDLILFQKAQTEGQKALAERLGWTVPPESEKLKWGRNRKRMARDFVYDNALIQQYIRFDHALVQYARTLPHAVWPG